MAIQKVKNKNGEWVIVSGVNKPLTIDSSLTDTSENPVKGKVIKEYVDYAIQNVEIDVDIELSDTSENPVQNKVVTLELNELSTKLDELSENVSGETVTKVEFNEAVTDINSRIDEANNDIAELSTGIVDNEEVSAAAFTDLNSRVNANYSYGENTYATKNALQSEITAINTIILDNEEIMAAALTDLNSRIESLLLRVEQLENA